VQKNINSKTFKHIEYFYDVKINKTIVLFALDQSIDANLFENKDHYRVEVISLNIQASSIPQENIQTAPYHHSSGLLWIQVIINFKYTAFCDYKCILYKNSEVIGEDYISIGCKLRDRFSFFAKKCLNPLSGLIFKLEPKPKAIISLHLWHLDVALEILEFFRETSRFFELRLAVPDNLDRAIPLKLVRHLEENYEFQKVSTLAVPSVGRDISGFVSSLIHSMKSPIDKNRLHLFLHTKNTPQLHPLLVRNWRKTLIFDIADQANFFIVFLLLKLWKASLIYAKSNDRIEDGSDQVDERKESYRLARALSRELFHNSSEKMRFCAGTMMWVMPARVEKVWSIEKLQAVLSKLEPSPTMQEPSHAHAFERLFPDIVRRSGLKVFRI
jgi:hypothetical protein